MFSCDEYRPMPIKPGYDVLPEGERGAYVVHCASGRWFYGWLRNGEKILDEVTLIDLLNLGIGTQDLERIVPGTYYLVRAAAVELVATKDGCGAE